MRITVLIPDSLPSVDINPSLKRRLGSLGSRVVTMISALGDSDGLTWVIGSRFGDSERMIKLFESIDQNVEVSPTDFTMSVHNALLGMCSILRQNKNGHTALSAGDRTFSEGFLEAYVRCKTFGQKVGYIFYDNPLPEIYNDTDKGEFFCCLFDPKELQTYKVNIIDEEHEKPIKELIIENLRMRKKLVYVGRLVLTK